MYNDNCHFSSCYKSLVLECISTVNTFEDEISNKNINYNLKYHENVIKSNRLIATFSIINK